MKGSCLLLYVLLFFSISATAHKAKKAKAKEIDSLYVFTPVSDIETITSGDITEFSDSLSNINASLLSTLLKNNGRIKFAGFVPVDPILSTRVSDEILMLISNAERHRYLEDIGIPTVIDSIMDVSSKRFALILFSKGFIRTKENFKTENQENLGKAIVSLGFYIEKAFKSGSAIYAMIIDAKENQTYYYKRSTTVGDVYGSPLSNDVLKERIKYLFAGFFWPKPNY
jgi:hypothetical protein